MTEPVRGTDGMTAERSVDEFVKHDDELWLLLGNEGSAAELVHFHEDCWQWRSRGIKSITLQTLNEAREDAIRHVNQYAELTRLRAENERLWACVKAGDVLRVWLPEAEQHAGLRTPRLISDYDNARAGLEVE